MIILGVDTSLRSTGFGVLETKGSRLVALDYGNIPNAAKVPLSECLRRIHAKIAELIAAGNPAVLSAEKVIHGKTAHTLLALGEARGAVRVAGVDAGQPIHQYAPRRARMAVCRSGLAEKEQVQRIVTPLLALPELPQNDAADALALAICHAHASPLLARGGTNLV